MLGRRAIPWAGAVVLLSACWTPSSQARNVNYAFLVGVSNYQRGELKPLRFTRNDIIDFSDELQRTGFKKENIVLMHEGQRDANRLPEAKKIKAELDLLLSSVEEGDTVIVALAGHGVQFLGEPASYFCPVDAVLEDRTTLIPLEDVYRSLDECAASRKLLLVDACRNDPQSPLARSRQRIKLESVTRPQEDALPRGIAAIFSCRPGQQSFEDDKLKHGVFFNFVLQGWKGAADGAEGSGQAADGKITLEEFTEFVKEQTKSYTRLNLKKSQNPISRNETDDTQAWVLCEVRSERRRAMAAFTHGDELFKQATYDAAIEEFTKAIRTDPTLAQAYVRRGQSYASLRMPDYNSAMVDFREALRREPGDVAALISRAGVYGRTGEYEDAIRDYTEAIQINGLRDDAYTGRGAAYAKTNRLAEALRDLNKAIELNQSNGKAYRNREFVHRRQGNRRSADADAARADELLNRSGAPAAR